MKKQLLLGAFLMGSFLTANAQDSCDDAVAVTVGDTYTVSAIEGDYEIICEMTNEQATAAAWYSFTATETGLLTITSVLDANPDGGSGTDTRVAAYTGDCDNLVCYAFNDDQNVTAGSEDYRSEITIPVEDGVTYYFTWDNNWQDTEFDFELSFEEASCFPVLGGYEYVGQPSTSEVTISWTPAIGSPDGYTVIWGEAGFDPDTDGETIETEEAQATFEGLTASTDYEFYIITDCGGGDTSDQVGPITFSTPVEPAEVPYETGFEDDGGDDLLGWTLLNNAEGSPWSLGSTDIQTPANDGEFFLQVGAFGAVSDSWTFSRGINLTAGTSYEISYFLMEANLDEEGNGNENNLEVFIGMEASIEGQTTSIGNLEDYNETEYEEQSHYFVAPETGIYHVGFNYTAPAHEQEAFGLLLLDTFSVQEGTAGINDVLASKFSIFPNPASNVIGFSNADNILVNGVVITDLNGRTVKTVNYAGVTEAQINVSDLAAGMYMMTVSSDQGTMSKKIVKN